MTSREIAELLEARERTVHAARHRHPLRAVKPRRESRFAAKDLQAFVDEYATREPGWRDNGPASRR